MEQIPTYLIIGSGKVSQHFQRYFSLLNIKFLTWNRSQNNLEDLVNKSDIILLAISDNAIADFVEQNNIIKEKILIHFSGSLYFDHIIGVHPLMTFTNSLQDLQFYQQIHMVIDCSKDKFAKIFPKFNNQTYLISSNNKPYYHALCVMSGNFSSILWSKIFEEFQAKLQIPQEAIYPYLQAIFENIKTDYKSALTGPLIRNDQITIDKNLDSLSADNFLPIYKSFLEYWRSKNDK
jgi:2-dehydropantoate 2-reductase